MTTAYVFAILVSVKGYHPERNTTMKVKAKEKANKPKVSLAIMGLLEMLVVASIGLSTAVIMIGTDDVVIKALLLPQVIYALSVIVRKFTK